jgi:hypothetical protein
MVMLVSALSFWLGNGHAYLGVFGLMVPIFWVMAKIWVVFFSFGFVVKFRPPISCALQ